MIIITKVNVLRLNSIIISISSLKADETGPYKRLFGGMGLISYTMWPYLCVSVLSVSLNSMQLKVLMQTHALQVFGWYSILRDNIHDLAITWNSW